MTTIGTAGADDMKGVVVQVDSTRGHGARLAGFALVLALLFSMLGSAPADAAGCCSVKREGSNIVITGTVPYRGANYITSGIVSDRGLAIGGQRCASKASGRNAYVKITIPIKYVPNGRYKVESASFNADYTRDFMTPSDWFRVRNSPAVHVDWTRTPKKIHRTADATFGFARFGDVRKTQCEFDGKRWRRCSSPKTYEGLREGKHKVRVRVLGRDGYRSMRGRGFTVDTKPPTVPTLDVHDGYYSADVTATGSRDAGTGVAYYEHRFRKPGDEVWSPIIRGDETQYFYLEDSGTLVKFRAVDGIGRKSAWAKTTVTVDA